ncbi:MAG: hypothetical protein IPM29_19920 [Planctomycetes bacterium]|nr:hypothetical protein [Planctomycetota bacterium]
MSLLLAVAACQGAAPAPQPSPQAATQPATQPAPPAGGAGARSVQAREGSALEPASSTAADVRAANVAAFEREGARLATDCPGDWVLIAEGRVRGHWRDFADAWQVAARESGPHLYLYRAGIDDGDATFVLSPFTNDDPHWTQLGGRFLEPLGLTIGMAPHLWSRQVGGRTLVARWPGDDAHVELVAADGGVSRRTTTVASALFDADVTLTETAATALGAGRIEAPGKAWYASRDWPCRKVLLRVRLPELEIDAPAIGYVLPADLTSLTGS